MKISNIIASPSNVDSLPKLPNIETLNQALSKKSKALYAQKIRDYSDNFILAVGNSKIESFPGIFIFEHHEDQSVEYSWHHPLDYGDGIINTVSLIDFNQDGLEDILVCLGDESNFFTHIFMNQGDKSFKRVYHEEGSYPTIVDLDGDNRPELIVNIYDNHKKEIPFEYRDFDLHKKEFNDFYIKIAGAYKDENCFYHPDYAWAALHLCYPIQIMEFENGYLVETTKHYQKHLRERIDLLHSLKPRLAKKEMDGLLEVINQLEEYGH